MTIQEFLQGKWEKENKISAGILGLTGVLFILSGICGQFLINSSRWVALTAALFSACMSVSFRQKFPRPFFLVPAVIDLIACIGGSWTLCTVAALINLMVGIILIFKNLRALFRAEGMILKIVTTLLLVSLFIVSLFLTFVTFFPAVTMRVARDELFGNGNVTDAQQSEATLENGVRVLSNVRYDTELPNGYLDIYYPSDMAKCKPMTIIYIHGGGYIWGDKVSGDPNAGNNSFNSSLIYRLADAGYPVISMNYALAPEYRYPNAIRQLSGGMHWIKEHSGELGLPPDGVAFAGASAGGNLAGVMANLQTNPAYAAQMELEPAFSGDDVKAVIFEGGLMDNRVFGVTHDIVSDYIFYHMGRVYLKTNELKGNNALAPSNVIDNVSANFPPSFISDGNAGTFYDQARAMEARLKELGVPVKLNIFSQEEAGVLGHGFEERGAEWGLKTVGMILDFLDEVG